MRSLRLVPYWSVHETLGVDAHNAPLKMRTRRIHLSRAVAWSCVRRHPVAGAALGSTDVDGSDPPDSMPRPASRELACAHPCHPPAGGRSPPEIPSGKAIKRRWERGGSTNPAAGRDFRQPGGSVSRPSEVGVARPSPKTAPRWSRLPRMRATCRAHSRALRRPGRSRSACAPWPAGARASGGSKGAEPPLASPCRGPAKRGPKG